jgi:hypothetical protein
MYEYVVIILTYHLVVTIRMSKLTIPQRKELKDLCKETLIRKLSQKESHAFVNSKLDGFNISYDYVQKVRNEISKNAKEELLHLERDQYALIQSLFFDRNVDSVGRRTSESEGKTASSKIAKSCRLS